MSGVKLNRKGGGYLQRDFAARGIRRGEGGLTPRARRMRLCLVVLVLVAWSGLVTWRLMSLQLIHATQWQEWALKQQVATLKVAPERGPIYDRNGRLMAVSVPAGSVYARPRSFRDEKERQAAALQLSKLVGLDTKQILRLIREDKPFVWVARQIPRAQAQQVEELGIKGLGYLLEPKRYYPYNQAASRLIGRVGVDGEGLSGLELTANSALEGQEVESYIRRDALGNIIDASITRDGAFEVPRGGSLKLTIDAQIQLIVDEELEAGRQRANAKDALAIVADAASGEILAMSQAPHVNFNTKGSVSPDLMRNLVAETVYEPGSTFKPMVAAAAIDAGLFRPSDMIDCEKGSFVFGRHVISDVHPNAVISLRDIIIRSSNIGMTKIGMRLGATGLYEALTKFGFGEASGLRLPGESAGILRDVSDWAGVDVATHSFGQGIAVTPLQMVRAMSALVADGRLPTMRLVAEEQSASSLKQVISPASARKVREMMAGVVEDEHGTGRNAAIPGVKVGGKTGTAQKPRPDGRGYNPGSYVASFIGYADTRALGIDHDLVAIVIVDEPNTKSIYGGTLAAPVFKRIMQRAISYLATSAELRGDELIEPEETQGAGFVRAALSY